MRSVLIMSLLLCAPCPLAAETVYVEASYGEVGNGWLFGSRKDGACWVAVPWHVVATMEAEDAAPFFFKTARNQTGEAAAPVRVSRFAAALEATNQNDDLAFARVIGGLRPSECLSRLGLPGLGFINALPTSDRLHVSAMQEGGRIGFAAELSRIVADADQGSAFLVRPRNEADRAFLQGGLSGSVVLMEWSGHLHPAGMVLSVLEDQSAALVLRFDKLRQAFEVVEVEGRLEPPVEAKVPATKLDILGIKGEVERHSTPLAQLVETGGCWRAARLSGEKTVDIVLSIKGLSATKPTSLHLIADPSCAPPETFVIERRDAVTGGWVMVSGSCKSGAGSATPCRLPPSAELELRLRSTTGAHGRLGLSGVQLR